MPSPGALSHHLQLGDGVRSLEVGCDEQRGVTLVLEPHAELAGQGGLAGTLQTDEHDDRRRVLGELDGAGLPAEDLDELLVDDLDDLLSGVESLVDLGTERPLADRADETLDHRQRDVGVEQRRADVAQRRIDVVLGQPTLATEVAEGGGQPVRQRGEHRKTLPVGPGG